MDWYYYVLIVIISIILLILLTTYICFLMTFYSPKKKKKSNELSLPPGEIYQIHKETIFDAIKYARSLSPMEMEIKSFDGLKLKGKYYECIKGAPIEIMFHGYKGDSERDLSNGIERCFKLNRNCIIVDQRASGESEGTVITFGIKESKDCLSWINHTIKVFGNDVKIILTGISMGASTVVIAAGNNLPPNVIGVLADCGYHSAKEIIKKTIKDMHLPANIFYPFVKLGAKIFGKFNLEETSPIEEIKKCKIPVIFIHGKADDFVPHYMSEKMYDACLSKKSLVSIENAGHGIAYLVEPKKYLDELDNFFKDELN